ncbi:hypothetical protein CU103_21655 [Phyllobacterium sophorae]|uniref:Uncharacterized protein n=1 Tax=Phyllobacterium sophorae TaxID=1520277 RepID=A0A2P7B627_9HYPH|nr:hypothetical protein CU103_21655 [Phyllobacterium sophorae]
MRQRAPCGKARGALVHYLALHRLASYLGQATLDCRLHSCIGKEMHQGAQTFRNIEETGVNFAVGPATMRCIASRSAGRT